MPEMQRKESSMDVRAYAGVFQRERTGLGEPCGFRKLTARVAFLP